MGLICEVMSDHNLTSSAMAFASLLRRAEWCGWARGRTQEDAGAGGNEIEYGRGRLANVADAGQGKLDPAEFLSRGRHGDWPVSS